MNNAKYIERYEQLVRVMRGLPRHERTKHFNMKAWGEDTKCGTTMCAAGFCGSDTWFRRRGFKFQRMWDWWDEKEEYTLTYRENMAWPAIRGFFGEGHVDERHPVFAKPRSVPEVIKAAEKEIARLRKSEKRERERSEARRVLKSVPWLFSRRQA